jgi:hypothetical protein
MEIVWTRLALITYKEVLGNLHLRWTKNEMKNFTVLTNELLEKIKNLQIVCPFANKRLGIQKGYIHKNVSLFYKEDKKTNTIYLITFFHNRMNPKELNKLLTK